MLVIIFYINNFYAKIGIIRESEYSRLFRYRNSLDLVFYNYLLKCFVLIDLKLGDLTNQDLGQMQMYVNYYTREMMNEGDNPPIGIVLCADKSDMVVKYPLPEQNTQIFASKYKLYLPTEDELRLELQRNYRALACDAKTD